MEHPYIGPRSNIQRDAIRSISVLAQRRCMGMRNRILRSARLAAIVLLAVVGARAQLYAVDSNNRYFAYGVGQRTCEDYVKFREKRLDALEQQHPRYTKDELYDIVNRIVEQWIAGFLTAHNLYVSDTYNVAAKGSMDDIEARLEAACRTNPKEYFAEAMVSVVQQLNPERVKTESAK